MIPTPSKILITGAAQGIGRALSRHFAQRGHKLFLIDINSKPLQHTAEVHLAKHNNNSENINNNNNMIAWSACDLADTSAIRDTITNKAARFFDGRIDFLINNAGISTPHWPDGMTMADPETLDVWRRYVDVNLTGNFAISQACIPFMKVEKDEDKQHISEGKVGSAGPCILNVSSFRGLVSDAHQDGYAATKAGLNGLTVAMAVSLAQYGIRVNTVSPGRIKATHENEEADKSGKEWESDEDDIETHLSNRAGMPEDITEAVDYLLGAGFVTGQNLVVDGGVTIQK